MNETEKARKIIPGAPLIDKIIVKDLIILGDGETAQRALILGIEKMSITHALFEKELDISITPTNNTVNSKHCLDCQSKPIIGAGQLLTLIVNQDDLKTL